MNTGSVDISPQMFTSLSSSFDCILANLVIPLAIKFIECCFMTAYIIKIACLVHDTKTATTLICKRLNPLHLRIKLSD